MRLILNYKLFYLKNFYKNILFLQKILFQGFIKKSEISLFMFLSMGIDKWIYLLKNFYKSFYLKNFYKNILLLQKISFQGIFLLN
jgi:hypothetical protein